MATREQKVHGVIHVAAVSAAAVGAGLAQLPGSDSVPLMEIQAVMIFAIAELHEQKITKTAVTTLLSEFVATISGRALSQWLVGWMPGWGNTLNAATAASITEAVGWAADAYFAKHKDKKAA